MDHEQLNSLLSTAGLVYGDGGINWANVIAGPVFGVAGFMAIVYGWKNKQNKPLIIGAALSVYPHFISNTIAVYVIGIGLCAGLYFSSRE